MEPFAERGLWGADDRGGGVAVAAKNKKRVGTSIRSNPTNWSGPVKERCREQRRMGGRGEGTGAQ